MTLPIVHNRELRTRLVANICIDSCIVEVNQGEPLIPPMFVHIFWELLLHARVGAVDESGCKISHDIPHVSSFVLQLILEINVVLRWNHNPSTSETNLVPPNVDASECNLLFLKKLT